jgi:hypothetical protein
VGSTGDGGDDIVDAFSYEMMRNGDIDQVERRMFPGNEKVGTLLYAGCPEITFDLMGSLASQQRCERRTTRPSRPKDVRIIPLGPVRGLRSAGK